MEPPTLFQLWHPLWRAPTGQTPIRPRRAQSEQALADDQEHSTAKQPSQQPTEATANVFNAYLEIAEGSRVLFISVFLTII